MSPRVSAVTNALVVVGVIGCNYWTAAFGIGGRTVGSMSDRYGTAFTPAGYAFSIWGLIFLALAANAGYQLWLAFRPDGMPSNERLAHHRRTFFGRMGPWLILTNVANATWLVLWLTEWTALSVLVLAAMVVFLTLAMWRLDMVRWDAPFEVVAFVWWPVAIYAGWCAVALLANLSAFLAKHAVIDSDSAPWALAMIGVATAYNLGLIAFRSLRVHALVAVWALVAIAVAQWDGIAAVKWGALGAAGLLCLAVCVHAVRHRRA